MYRELISNIIEGFKGLGVFIGGIGAFSAARSFKQYRAKERSEAAAKALIIVKNCLDKIIDIEQYQGLYESQGYDPENRSETFLENKERDLRRPFILLSERKHKFKKEFQEPTIKIAGKEFILLNEISDRIMQLINELLSFLPKETSDMEFKKQMILEHRKQCQPWIDKISKVRKETEDILFPIINGINWWSRVCNVISNYLFSHRDHKGS